MVLCHDRTPFLNYECPDCGFIYHIHKSQLPATYPDIELRTICQSCRSELILPKPATWTGEN